MAGTLMGIGIVVVLIAVVGFASWLSFGSERAFWRGFASRSELDEQEFLREFYPDSEVHRDVARRLRSLYCEYFDMEVGKLRPTDRPPIIDDIDAVDLVMKIESEFNLTITDDDAERIDGSFDSIVQYLARCLS